MVTIMGSHGSDFIAVSVVGGCAASQDGENEA